MLPYILTYTLSCLTLNFSVRFKDRVIRNLFVAIAVLMPVFLAAFRARSVGTDTISYAHLFTTCSKYTDFIKFYTRTDTNIGFAAFNYLISRFTSNCFWLFFAIQFSITVLVWKAIDENVPVQYKALAMLVYYLMFYSYSLNLMRQMIAAAIVLYGYRFIKKRMPFRYLVCIACATLFHTTALVGSVIYLIYWLSLGDDEKKAKKRKAFYFREIIRRFRVVLIFAGLVLSAVCVYYGREIIAFMHYQLFDFYKIYSDSLSGTRGGTLRYTAYMLTILLITAWRFREKNTQFIFYVTISVLSLILFYMKQISTQAFRISLYFSIYYLILIPQEIANIRLKRNRQIVCFTMILILSLYSFDFFVLQSYNGTFPYLVAK